MHVGLATIPDNERRKYVQEHLTVLHDERPSPFVVAEIVDYLTQEDLWDSKELDVLITHLHGYHQFKNEQRRNRIRARAGEGIPDGQRYS
jgi:hypothetical protein